MSRSLLDRSDATNDVSVLPNALVWIYALEQTVVVVAVQRLGTDAEYLAKVSTWPFALAVHVAERRLGVASDRPTES